MFELARSVYHVVHNSDKEVWQIKKEGSSTAIKNCNTKSEAIDYAVGLAKNNEPSQVKIHKKDGTIESERTYGDDPYPPVG